MANTRVGHMVHYVSYGTPGGEYQSQCRAAVVTELPVAGDKSIVHLCVLNPGGSFFDRDLSYDNKKVGGTWHKLEDCNA